MRALVAAIVLLAVTFGVAGCSRVDVGFDESGGFGQTSPQVPPSMERTCPVHDVVVDPVRETIFDDDEWLCWSGHDFEACMAWTEVYANASAASFPMARIEGKTRSRDHTARVWVCEECAESEKKWRRWHPEPW